MENQDFSMSMVVKQSPAAVLNTLLNVRAWWSGLYDETFEGSSGKVGDEFSFRAGAGAHYTKQKMVELVPDKRVVWLVTDANLSFVDKTDEWNGTRICFDVSEQEGETKIVFTHIGLQPEFECYESCAAAWTLYLQERLTAALNRKENISNKSGNIISIILLVLLAFPCEAQNSHHRSVTLNRTKMKASDFTTTLLVDQTPEKVFNSINNVRGWWSETVEGSTDKLNEQFLYYYKDVHISKMKIVEFVPNKKVVWQVLENHFSFTKDKTEWKGTKIVFEIFEKDKKTELRFTHVGLVPQYECYGVCRDAWTSYIQGSLKDLITTGKGKPNAKEGGLNAELIEKWKLPIK